MISSLIQKKNSLHKTEVQNMNYIPNMHQLKFFSEYHVSLKYTQGLLDYFAHTNQSILSQQYLRTTEQFGWKGPLEFI